MQTNLVNYEKLVKEKKNEGHISAGSLAVFELDRAFGKTYAPSMTLDMSPCLKTQLRYLFVLSTDDVDLPDNEREFSRWVMPFERPGLQGVSPQVALHMRAGDILHATGNAYPVPLIGACLAPVLTAMSSFVGKKKDWSKKIPAMHQEDDLPDVQTFFQERLPTKEEKIKKEKTSKKTDKEKKKGKKTGGSLKRPASKSTVKKTVSKPSKKTAKKPAAASKRKSKSQGSVLTSFGFKISKTKQGQRGGSMASSNSG